MSAATRRQLSASAYQIAVALDVQGPPGITVELIAVVETECDLHPENDSDTIGEPLPLY